MVQFDIQTEHPIPYFDHGTHLGTTIRNSSKRRGMSPLRFAVRKVKNILLYRWAYSCPLNSWRVRFNRWRGVHIGKNVYIGIHCSIDNAYPEYVYIEDNVSLAGDVIIVAHNNPYAHFQPIVEAKVAPVVVREGAWVGSNVTILLGTTIGVKSIVSAGTVVEKNVPDYSMAKGNPMKIIAEYESLITQ